MSRAASRAAACLCLALTGALVSDCGRRHVKTGRKVIVLGFDGLDYDLTRDLIAKGQLPNFARLATSGGFAPLATVVPPQSPVAWSTFITGLDPGHHGIFDFVHRDPKTMEPFLSTSKVEGGGRTVKIGKWQFPLQAGRVELLRRGEAFWDVLERRGIETTIIRMPANFPPSGTATRELSGMGTPDVLGGYGIFSFFTSEPFAFGGKELSGGIVVPVDVVNGVVHTALEGPDNPFLVKPEKTHAPFTVHIDSRNRFIKLVVGSEERLLGVGEWSDWVPVELELIPLQKIAGACRFYLKQLSPYFELYVSPVQLDPLSPALPVSTPTGFAAELARTTGRFYTQGLPEDTKALKTGVLTPNAFLEQARIAGDENTRQFHEVLKGFTDGLLFYYFGNGDQISHMMWRAMDPQHPAYTSADEVFRHVVEDVYVGFDRLVGEAAARLGPEDLLVVMSDHGFTSWRRSFHLNSWLHERGYLALRNPDLKDDPGGFANVDWSRTRAYALGLNGLFINVRGREVHGTVDPQDREALAAEIADALAKTIDPKTGTPSVAKVFRREQVYQLRNTEDLAPDLIVGYSKGTRGSDESALGSVPPGVIIDNMDPWGADHCMDPAVVPGILLTSRSLKKPAPGLQTLAAAIVAEFGVSEFPRRSTGE